MSAHSPAMVVPDGVERLPTPLLVVDVTRLDRNIHRVADLMAQAGVALRPHAKTSKSVDVCARQRAAGAIGFTCATPGEVAMLAAAGFGGLLWAHVPVGPWKVDFAVHQARTNGLTVVLDTVAAGLPLAHAAAAAGIRVPFLLEVDTGHGRVGTHPDDALAVALALDALPGLQLCGVLTHEGHLGSLGADLVAREAAGTAVARQLVDVARSLRDRGLAARTVSVGSTPGLTSTPWVDGVTEARPGTYAYGDAIQAGLGSTRLEDCALTVLTRVVTIQRGRAIVDAGLKALSSDAVDRLGTGGLLCQLDGTPATDLTLGPLNEEHGFLHGPGVARLQVGDLLRIIPNHACGTVNMWGSVLACTPSASTTWPISGRH